MVKINKSQARKQYELGVTVYITPCKMRLGNMWNPEIEMNKYNLLEVNPNITFDGFINEFEYYNCDYERGYYTSYYIK